jgi:hypothetical protein
MYFKPFFVILEFELSFELVRQALCCLGHAPRPFCFCCQVGSHMFSSWKTYWSGTPVSYLYLFSCSCDDRSVPRHHAHLNEIIFFCWYFFLWFGLRALCLLHKHSTTWATPPALANFLVTYKYMGIFLI